MGVLNSQPLYAEHRRCGHLCGRKCSMVVSWRIRGGWSWGFPVASHFSDAEHPSNQLFSKLRKNSQPSIYFSVLIDSQWHVNGKSLAGWEDPHTWLLVFLSCVHGLNSEKAETSRPTKDFFRLDCHSNDSNKQHYCSLNTNKRASIFCKNCQ